MLVLIGATPEGKKELMGGCLSDFAWCSGYPSIAAVPGDPGIDARCQEETFCDTSERLPHDLPDARRSLRFKKRLAKTIADQKTSKSWPVTTVPLYNCRISSNTTSSGFGTAMLPPGLAR